MPKKEYGAVDLFKLLCSYMVIAIHTKPFQPIGILDDAVGMMTRFAVPFFFITSAYFLFWKLDATAPDERFSVVKITLLRLLRFYGIWFVLENLLSALLEHKLQNPLYYIKQFFFTTNGSPLWFLCALIWGLILTFVFNRFCGKKVTFIISIVFLAIGYLFSTWKPLFVGNPVFDAVNRTVISLIGTQNGLFFAFPYVALGSLMSGKEVTPHFRRDLAFTAGFFVLLGAEAVFAVKVVRADLTFLWLSALPMTYFLFWLMMGIQLKPNKNYYTIRKISTLNYVCHILLLKPIALLISSTALAGIDSLNLIFFLLTAVLTTAASWLLVTLSRRPRLAFLKYIT